MFHVKHSSQLGTVVSRETTERLMVLADLLSRWNPRINLVSTGDLPHLWQRHIEDSLQLVQEIPPGAPFIDLGSGGGFPGLVLAIANEKSGDLDRSRSTQGQLPA